MMTLRHPRLLLAWPLVLAVLAACGAAIDPQNEANEPAELTIAQSPTAGCPPDANRPGGTLRCATVANFTEIATGQRCRNWCWAAGAEMLVRSQGVVVRQEEFVRKIYGPALPCYPSGNFDNIVKAIAGTYPKQGGGTVNLNAAYSWGIPTDTFGMIRSIEQGRPFLFAYSGHALVAYGLSWQQIGAKRSLREILLIDPYFPYGSPKYRRFRVGIDNASGIQGTLELLVN
jgi:hypothetical protein